VVGRQVTGLERRGKLLLVHFEGETTLLVHLGMSGRLVVRQPGAPLEKHEHVIFDLESSVQVRYRDPRRFGALIVLPTQKVATQPFVARLGPEPLDPRLDPRVLYRKLRTKRQPIKNALLDQRVLAGLGNIYTNEALFRAGISPLRPAGDLSEAEVAHLLGSVRDVLREALNRGGTTLRDYADPEGNAGLFALELQVYGRTGQPCPRCGAPIRTARLAGRSTFWCERCQK